MISNIKNTSFGKYFDPSYCHKLNMHVECDMNCDNCKYEANYLDGLIIPTCEEALKIYEDFVKFKKYSNQTLLNTRTTFKRAMKYMGIDMKSKITEITWKKQAEMIEKYQERISSSSIDGLLSSIKCVTGKKVKDYVRRIGNWYIPQIELIDFEYNKPRYKSLTDDEFEQVKAFFFWAYTQEDPRIFTFFVFAFCYAMRKRDIKNLRWSDIINENNTYYLKYIPLKTKRQSNKEIKFAMDKTIVKLLLDKKNKMPKQMRIIFFKEREDHSPHIGDQEERCRR